LETLDVDVDLDLDEVEVEVVVPTVEPRNLAKMSIKALRDLAVSQGLVADASKMKKADVLALLNGHNVEVADNNPHPK